MNVTILPATIENLPAYARLLQRAYTSAYVDESIGLTPECFSMEIFNTPDTQNYLRSNLVNNDSQNTYLAWIKQDLIGSITIKKVDQMYEINGFYVHPEYQGLGVGGQLWRRAVDMSRGAPIILDTYAHNTRTLDIYQKWGFVVDTSRGENGYFTRHWPEWPEDLNPLCVYLRLPH